MPRSARPADTSPEVWRVMRERDRAMTPAQRAMEADALSGAVAELALVGIRTMHPDYSEEQVRHELTRRRYGRALADAVHPEVSSTR